MMMKQNLAGAWRLLECDNGRTTEGHLPGCNYLDLINAGVMDDPFWGDNELEAKKLSEKDYEYSRCFKPKNGLCSFDRIDLVISGLDTLATVSVNGHEIARTDNAHRSWRFPVKQFLKESEDNEIKIHFDSPYPYINEMQEKNPVSVGMSLGVAGLQHIRKPMCNFGWDWAPVLPPCGIFGGIALEGYTTARLQSVQTQQRHEEGRVTLLVDACVEEYTVETSTSLTVQATLTAPDGSQREFPGLPVENGKASVEINIDHPQLWWCNGLGEQPLYDLEVVLENTPETGGARLDSWKRSIGLRTIQLNTDADEWGNNFQFRINGAPIFAKGADWVPTDSFITRTSAEKLDFYIRSAKEANMNMLRVWGGGYYGSDDFYDLCDKYGILVWQDIAFACVTYPLNSSDYLALVKPEVRDNVERIRHHASLALWCGNNEIAAISGILPGISDELKEAEERFFFSTLPSWISRWDDKTTYWPGSPTNGFVTDEKANSLKRGDTHLWQVWHGMQPLEAFQKYTTRFCSEYGTESLPSVKTLLKFTDNPEIDLFDPIMLQHQKSGDGNEKMLYYILSRYRQPATTRDFIYLSQLIQAETIRLATEQWRRRMGQCNGSLYWQYNDCWPTASWAGIEYDGIFKAVQYKSRHFNSMLCCSADLGDGFADLYITNDYPAERTVTLRWALRKFTGETLAEGEKTALIPGFSAYNAESLRYDVLLNGTLPTETVLKLELNEGGETVSLQSILLVPDKDALLQKPAFKTGITLQDGLATLTIEADTFARHVCLTADGATGPFSDNFFDIEKGCPFTVTFPVEADATEESIRDGLSIHSLADVETTGTPEDDQKLYESIFMKDKNQQAYVLYDKYL